jgi:hypothetical protein
MTKFLPGRSYLYTDEITPEILRENRVEIIDLLQADLSELGVKELRSFLSLAGQKPLGENRLLWLKNADGTSEGIQNTLLKIAEEPPANLIIVLQARSVDDLLPTLRSRLHRLDNNYTSQVGKETFPDTFAELTKMLTGFKDKATLVECLGAELTYLKGEMLAKPSQQTSSRINLLGLSLRRLRQNCNQKLVVDQLLLGWLD